jgi:hypothetical protein
MTAAAIGYRSLTASACGGEVFRATDNQTPAEGMADQVGRINAQVVITQGPT